MQVNTHPGEGSAEGAIAKSALDGVSPPKSSEPNGVRTTCSTL
jgi:hypothetical protein